MRNELCVSTNTNEKYSMVNYFQNLNNEIERYIKYSYKNYKFISSKEFLFESSVLFIRWLVLRRVNPLMDYLMSIC